MQRTSARPTTAVTPAQHLGPAQRAQLRARLEEQRAFRLDQLVELRAADCRSDELAEVVATLREGAESALVEIDAALDRHRTGDYGSCVTCGEAIPVERLEIIPMAASCVRCQRAREHSR